MTKASLSLRRGIVEALLVSALGQIILLVTGVIVARLLGVEHRGYFALLALVALIISSLGHLGVPFAGTVLLAKSEVGRAGVLSCMDRFFRWQSALLALLPLPVFLVLSEGLAEAWLVAVFAIPAVVGQLASFYGLAVLQGKGVIRLANVLRIAQLGIYLGGLLVVLIVGDGSLLWVCGAWAVSTLVAGIGTYRVALGSTAIDRDHHKCDPRTTAELLRFGLRGFLGGVSPIESLRLDQLLVAITFSAYSLGLFVVALAFINIPRWIAHSFTSILVPHLALSHSESQISARTLWRSVGTSSLINLVIAVVLIGLMPYLVSLLFGEQFSDAAPVAQVLILGAVALSTRRVLCDGMRAIGVPEIATWAEFVTYLAILVTWYPLTSKFGLVGVAVCLLLSHLVGLIVACVKVYRTFAYFRQ